MMECEQNYRYYYVQLRSKEVFSCVQIMHYLNHQAVERKNTYFVMSFGCNL